MITAIRIKHLRGIRTGALEGLGPLTILTGPNACGKSTVLDGLLVAASPNPAAAVGRVVSRHPAVMGGSRWLFFRGEQEAVVELEIAGSPGFRRKLEWVDDCEDRLESILIARRSVPPFSMIRVAEPGSREGEALFSTAFGGDNQAAESVPERLDERAPSPVPFARLVDPGLPIPLHQSFSEVTRVGRREAVHELLADLLPGFERLEIIATSDRDFGLAVTCNGISVPLGLSGDGIQALMQIALEIAVAPEGLVLVEEPEVYQHPKAIRQSARALLANMRRGVQTVVTTHSLELIDALLAQAGEDLPRLVLFNLELDQGELVFGRRAGEEIMFARGTLENDLR